MRHLLRLALLIGDIEDLDLVTIAACMLVEMRGGIEFVGVNFDDKFLVFLVVHCPIFSFRLSLVTSHPLGGVVVPPNGKLHFLTKES